MRRTRWRLTLPPRTVRRYVPDDISADEIERRYQAHLAYLKATRQPREPETWRSYALPVPKSEEFLTFKECVAITKRK